MEAVKERIIGQQIYYGDTANQALVIFVCMKPKVALRGYFIGEGCIGCGTCVMFCPQQCIDLTGLTAKIDQKHCLHCGSCVDICPMQAIEKRG